MNNINEYIQNYLNNNIFILDEQTIIEYNIKIENVGLNNVIAGIKERCYGLWINNDEEIINYDVFYIESGDHLSGELLNLTSNLKYQKEILFGFANNLSIVYNSLDVIDTFNTFQDQIRGLFEKYNYFTYSSQDFVELNNNDIIIFPKRARQFDFISKIEFYRAFFNNLNISSEEADCCFIYLMLNVNNNYLKIGRSKNPIFREKTLQSEEPEISIIAKWKAPIHIEKDLHKHFSDKRVRGEWFKLNFNDLNFILKEMNNYK